MKRGSDLRYLHTDHLNSNSVVTNADGTLHSSQDYCAYGGKRIATWYGHECDPTAANPLPTDRTFTGQEQDSTGLMYYRARFMDPALGTFISPDTLVPDPGRAGDFNRFAYTRNNPLKFSDPTGHRPDDGCETEGCTLPNGLAPDAAWLLTNGAYAHVDPQIVAAEDYNPVTEALLPGAAMLVGGITGGIVAGDLLLAGASLLSGWFGTAASATSAACADGDCTNEVKQGGQVLQRWGPHTGLGPLPERIANTFRSASYSETKLTADITLYRSYGGRAGELSSYWTRTQPSGPMQAQMDGAILPEWGNTLAHVAQIRVPAGTIVYEGYAAEQANAMIKLIGGGSQVYIPYVDPSWLMK